METRTVHVPLSAPLWRRLQQEAARELRSVARQAATLLASALEPLAESSTTVVDKEPASWGRPFANGQPPAPYLLLLCCGGDLAAELLLAARRAGAADVSLAAVAPATVPAVERLVVEGRRLGGEVFDLTESTPCTRPNGCRVYHLSRPWDSRGGER